MAPTRPERTKTPPLHRPVKRSHCVVDQEAPSKLTTAAMRRKHRKKQKSRQKFARRYAAERKSRMAVYNNARGLEAFDIESESNYDSDSNPDTDSGSTSYSSSDSDSDSEIDTVPASSTQIAPTSSVGINMHKPESYPRFNALPVPDLSKVPISIEGMGCNRLAYGFHKGVCTPKVCSQESSFIRIIDRLRSDRAELRADNIRLKENPGMRGKDTDKSGQKILELTMKLARLEKEKEAVIQENKALKKDVAKKEKRIQRLEARE